MLVHMFNKNSGSISVISSRFLNIRLSDLVAWRCSVKNYSENLANFTGEQLSLRCFYNEVVG